MKTLLCTLALAGGISTIAMSAASTQAVEEQSAAEKALAKAKGALKRAFAGVKEAPEPVEGVDIQEATQDVAREYKRALELHAQGQRLNHSASQEEVREYKRALELNALAQRPDQEGIKEHKRALELHTQAQRLHGEALHEREHALRTDVHVLRESEHALRDASQAKREMAHVLKEQAHAEGERVHALRERERELAHVIRGHAAEQGSREAQMEKLAHVKAKAKEGTRRFLVERKTQEKADSKALVKRLKELEAELQVLSNELHDEGSDGSHVWIQRNGNGSTPHAAPRTIRVPRTPAVPRTSRAPRTPAVPRAPRAPSSSGKSRILRFSTQSDEDCSGDCDDESACEEGDTSRAKKFKFKTKFGGGAIVIDERSTHSGHASADGNHFLLDVAGADEAETYSVDVNASGVTVFQVTGEAEPRVLYRHSRQGNQGTSVWSGPEGHGHVVAPSGVVVDIAELPGLVIDEIEIPEIAELLFEEGDFVFEENDFDFPDFEVELEDFDFPEIEVHGAPEFEIYEMDVPEPSTVAPGVGVHIRRLPTKAAPMSLDGVVSAARPHALGRIGAGPSFAPPATLAGGVVAADESDVLAELMDLMRALKTDMGSLQADIRSLHAEIGSVDPH